MKPKTITLTVAILVIALCMAGVAKSAPMGTAFTYQGRLVDANSPADGLYDFEFEVYNYPDAGSQQGTTVDVNDLVVADGYFAVALDFGSDVFTGDARWLQIAVRDGASSEPNDFATLSPRQEVTPTPYALYAKTAGGDGDWTISGDDMYSGVSGKVGIGTTTPSHRLTLESYDYQTLRFIGPDVPFGYGAKLNFGDAEYVYIQEDEDDRLKIYANGRTAIMGGNVGIGTTTPITKLHIKGDNPRILMEGDSSNPEINFKNSGDAPTQVWAIYKDTATEDLRFFQNGDKVTIQNSTGNVGIGTMSPQVGLHLKGQGWPDSFMALQSDPNEDTGFRLIEGGTVKWHLFNESPVDGLSLRNNAYSSILFAEQNTGNVGIGTTSPVSELTVKAAGDGGQVVSWLNASGVPAGSLQTASGSPSGAGAINLNDGLGATRIMFSAYTDNSYFNSGGNLGIGTTSPTGRLQVVGDEVRIGNAGTVNYATGDGDLYVEDVLEVDSRAYINELTATSTGFVSAGASGPVIFGSSSGSHLTFDFNEIQAKGTPSTGATLYANYWGGDVNIADGGGVVISRGIYDRTTYTGSRYYVMIDGVNKLHRQTSSARYKENIKPLQDDFHKILNARPKSFQVRGADIHEIGYIAEEFDQLGLGRLVVYDEQGRPDALRYDLISVYLLEVLKDQAEAVNQLKAENESLREQLKNEKESLEQRLAAVEKILSQPQFAKMLEVQNGTN